MNLDKYIDLLTRIIDNDKISENKKIILIRMLDRIKNLDENSLNILENKAYSINHKPLTEEEKIAYEINRLLSLNGEDELLKLQTIAYLNHKAKNKKDYEKIKIMLSELIIKYGEIPEFYSIYEKMVKKSLNEDKHKSTIKTAKKV